MKLISLILIFGIVSFVVADMYMHNPAGSNCRNRERNRQRANAERLFDSQNNAQGGYPWRGDAIAEHDLTQVYANAGLRYLAGSWLNVEWTNQHGCGPNSNLDCRVVIQYSCDWDNEDWWYGLPGARTGYPSGAIVSSDENANAQKEDGSIGYLRREFQSADQNQQGTESIPDFLNGNEARDGRLDDPQEIREFYMQGLHEGIEFGLHESPYYHDACYKTERNKGLYTADRNVNNGQGSTATIENNNGYNGNSNNRNGFECPEERDYYPWWRPSPWIDVAILTNKIDECEDYVQHSFNIESKWICECDTPQCDQPSGTPNNNQACLQAGGTWVEKQSHLAYHNNDDSITVPVCEPHPFNRDNHLGASTPLNRDNQPQLFESGEPEMATYKWQIPAVTAGKQCVLRMRYNISVGELTGGLTAENNCENIVRDVATVEALEAGNQQKAELIANRVTHPHCNAEIGANGEMPAGINRPYFKLYDDMPRISVSYKTNQIKRQFQDRSYVFQSMEAPADGPNPFSDTVINLNCRGRRGNIVQTYPSVEYDFVPTRLVMTEGDYVHIQFFGSDFDETLNANNGEGWRYSSRCNIIQTEEGSVNYPMIYDEVNPERNMLPTKQLAKDLAFVGQDPTECRDDYNGNNNNDNNDDQQAPENCGKLNRAPAVYPSWANRFSTLFAMDNAGTFYYASTRNNNFSNRSQKASIVVEANNVAWIIIGSLAGVIVAAGITTASVCAIGKKSPNSCCGRMVNRG